MKITGYKLRHAIREAEHVKNLAAFHRAMTKVAVAAFERTR